MGHKNKPPKPPKPPKMPQSNGITELVFDGILLVVGIMLIVWPNDAAELMTRIVGIVLLILALIEIVVFVCSKNKEALEVIVLIVSLIIASIGIFLIINPGWLVGFFNIIFGIIIGVYGLFGIVNSVAFARRSGGLWWIGLIMSVIAISLAVLVFMNPVWISNMIMIAIGIALIFAAITGVYNRIRIRKAQKIILGAFPPPPGEVPVDVSTLKSAGSSDEEEEN